MPTRYRKNAAFWWDYTSPCIYMLTLNKRAYISAFGKVRGRLDSARGQPDYPCTYRSPLGSIILSEVNALKYHILGLKLHQYILMPDHLHLIIQITMTTPRQLDDYIYDFMSRVDRRAVVTQLIEADPHKDFIIFEPDFNDQIIGQDRNLNSLFEYLRLNPYRYLQRQLHPDFFTRISSLQLCGHECQAYGNVNLLSHPVKAAVVIHRRYTPLQLADYRRYWLTIAANGGVLVSPFISEAEKELLRTALTLHSKIILLKRSPFRERQKPGGKWADYCADGRLLILAPLDPAYLNLRLHNPDAKILRDECLYLNSLAEAIAALPGGPA